MAMNFYQQIGGGGAGAVRPLEAEGSSADVLLSDPLEKYNESDFRPAPYSPSRNVEDQHRFWRAGHTNEFNALVGGVTHKSEGTAEDYIVGILAGAMLIFGIALAWFVAIVGLKVAGRKRVGFLAGRLVHQDCEVGNSVGDSAGTLPAIPEEPEITTEAEVGTETEGGSLLDAEMSAPLIISDSIVEDAEKEKRQKKFDRKVMLVRLAFVFSALAVMVCGILFYSKGVASFKRSLDNVDDGLSMVQNTANEAIKVTQSLDKEKGVLQRDMNRTKHSVTGEICDGSGPIAQEIESRWREAQADLKELDETVSENVELFVNDLNEVISMADDAKDYLHYADIFFGIAIAVSVIINLLILSMLAVTYFSARGIENCCTKLLTYAVLWPVFVFFLVFFWIFSLLFLVFSLAGSDFCVQPDAYVEGFLRKNQDMFGSAIFQFAIYWVSGCTIKPHNEKFTELKDQIEEGITVTHDFAEAIINQPIPQLEGECGLSNAGAAALNGGAALLHNATHSVNRLWIETRAILECGTFNPIYTKFAHDALCIDGVGGLTWLFTTSMFLFLFAMIMIMFRAALYPVKRPQAGEGGGLSASLLSKSGT